MQLNNIFIIIIILSSYLNSSFIEKNHQNKNSKFFLEYSNDWKNDTDIFYEHYLATFSREINYNKDYICKFKCYKVYYKYNKIFKSEILLYDLDVKKNKIISTMFYNKNSKIKFKITKWWKYTHNTNIEYNSNDIIITLSTDGNYKGTLVKKYKNGILNKIIRYDKNDNFEFYKLVYIVNNMVNIKKYNINDKLIGKTKKELMPERYQIIKKLNTN